MRVIIVSIIVYRVIRRNPDYIIVQCNKDIRRYTY